MKGRLKELGFIYILIQVLYILLDLDKAVVIDDYDSTVFSLRNDTTGEKENIESMGMEKFHGLRLAHEIGHGLYNFSGRPEINEVHSATASEGLAIYMEFNYLLIK